MSLDHFVVCEHVLPASHIRGYPRATRTKKEEEPLHIAIKQYTPKTNQQAQQGDVTIIAAHANGVPKELYEPFWDDLLQYQTPSFRIRSIWIADVSFQGQSSVLNEARLGNDPSWYDHPRDLFLMINHFREQMPRPLIGFGHSMGGNNIVNLSLMHPRLFTALILCDPVIFGAVNPVGNFLPGIMSTFRRDIWPSREAAEETFRQNKFYQEWDDRALRLWIKYGLRELPTALYPTSPADVQKASKTREKPVTLTTTKHNEVFAFYRAIHPPAGQDLASWTPPHDEYPDVNKEVHRGMPFYNPAVSFTFTQLPHVRPKVLYILASNSPLSQPGAVQNRLEQTGVGVGGSGGVARDAVESLTIANAGHFVPFEKPRVIAGEVGKYLDKALKQWHVDEEKAQKAWEAVEERQRFTISDDSLWWTKKLREDLFPKKQKQKL